MEAYTCTLWT